MTPTSSDRPSATRRSPRRGRILLVGGALLATVATPVIVGGAAIAAPGSPGVPQPGVVLLDEDFQNVAGPSPIAKLDAYVGANGELYTADAPWLTACNGWITSTAQAAGATAPPAASGECNNQLGWNAAQQLAHALGVFGGLNPSQGGLNYSVSAYTQAHPGANLVEFETVNNLDFLSPDRYVKFSVDIAALNCATASAPTIQFSALDYSGAATPIGGVINGCSSTTSIAIPAFGVAPARAALVGTYGSNAALLVNGPSVGLRLVNTNGSGAGNDHAFDNVRIIDVTPQLDTSFSPATIAPEETTTLQFTITNTAELDAKDGWSYTDTLPSGLAVAGDASTDCPAGAVTTVNNSASIVVTGNLAQGLASCVVTIPVEATTAGTYTNGAADIAAVGLDLPSTATLTVAPTLAVAPPVAVAPTLAATGSDSTGVIATGLTAISLGSALMLVLAAARRRASRAK